MRTAFGVSLGLVLIYAAYTHNFSPMLLPLAIGFWLVHLFGDLYNDYVDYEQDVKNDRTDKWIISGLISARGMKYLTLTVLTIGLATLLFTNIYVLLLGTFYAVMLAIYSNPKIGIRRYNVLGYFLIGAPTLFFSSAFNSYFGRSFGHMDIFFTVFAFSNYVYLYCQKDSTDLRDDTNLFIKRGWKAASLICTAFASVAILAFLGLSLLSTTLLAVWVIHTVSKWMNLYRISEKKIDRTLRGRLILLEFITPYLYAGGVVFV